jgi:hypothetical protein
LGGVTHRASLVSALEKLSEILGAADVPARRLVIV